MGVICNWIYGHLNMIRRFIIALQIQPGQDSEPCNRYNLSVLTALDPH